MGYIPQELQFRLLSTLSNDIFFQYDLETNSMYISEMISKKLGLKRIYSPMPNAFIEECVFEDDKEAALAFFQNKSEDKTQLRLHFNGNKEAWYAGKLCKGENTEHTFVGYFRDIQKEVEQSWKIEDLKVINFVQYSLLMALNNPENAFKFLDYLTIVFGADQIFIAMYEQNLDIQYSSSDINSPHRIFKTKEMLFTLDKKYLKHTGNIEYIQNLEDFEDIHHFIEVPLLDGDGSTIGIIGIVNANLDKMSEKTLIFIANSVSLTLQNLKSYEELEKISIYDVLTGVKNRNAYETYLKKFNSKSLQSLGLIVVDINGLKVCNDTSGHIAGDSLIKHVANCLSCVFGSEIVYRFGGDEFIVLCENVTKEAVENMIRDFSAHLKNASVSLGYSYEKDNISIQNMLIKADEKMYISKEKFYNSQKN